MPRLDEANWTKADRFCVTMATKHVNKRGREKKIAGTNLVQTLQR